MASGSGYWELNYASASGEDATKGRLMFVAYLRDLKSSSPDAFKDLLGCIKASLSEKLGAKLDKADLTKLIPPRETCRRCGAPIPYNESLREHEWNVVAMDAGFCSEFCLKEFA